MKVKHRIRKVNEKMKASNVQRCNVVQLVEALKPQLVAKVGRDVVPTAEILQAAFKDVVNKYNATTTVSRAQINGNERIGMQAVWVNSGCPAFVQEITYIFRCYKLGEGPLKQADLAKPGLCSSSLPDAARVQSSAVWSAVMLPTPDKRAQYLKRMRGGFEANLLELKRSAPKKAMNLKTAGVLLLLFLYYLIFQSVVIYIFILAAVFPSGLLTPFCAS